MPPLSPPPCPAALTPLAPQRQCSSLRPAVRLPGTSWSVPVSAGPGLSPQPPCSLDGEAVQGGGQVGEPAWGQKMPAGCRPQTQAWELFLQRQVGL